MIRLLLVISIGLALLTGCNKQNKTEQSILFQPMELGKNANVSCFAIEDNGSLWLGLDGEGLAYKESLNSPWRFYNKLTGTLPADVVICNYHDTHNRLWFGSFDNGLFFWDGDNFQVPQWAQTLTYVSGFVEDATHQLWISTLKDGIACADTTGKLTLLNEHNSGLATNYVTDLKTIDHQTIYIATGWGLFKLNAQQRHITPVTDKQGKPFLDKRLIRSLYVAKNDSLLWIGTQTGLYIYHISTREFRHLTTADGLADNYVKAIGSDRHDNIWIASDTTLTRLSPTLDGNYNSLSIRRNNGIGDGIFHVRAIACKADGTMLFGTSKGCLTIKNPHASLPVKNVSAATTLFLFLLSFAIICLLLLLLTYKGYFLQHKKKREGKTSVFNDIEPSPVQITPLDQQLKEKAIHTVEEHISEAEFSVEQLSDLLGMSRGHLYKRLTAITGLTPQEFIRTIRVKRGRQLLEQSGESIQQVAWHVGLSPKQFAKYFKEEYGLLPSDFIRKKEGTLF